MAPLIERLKRCMRPGTPSLEVVTQPVATQSYTLSHSPLDVVALEIKDTRELQSPENRSASLIEYLGVFKASTDKIGSLVLLWDERSSIPPAWRPALVCNPGIVKNAYVKTREKEQVILCDPHDDTICHLPRLRDIKATSRHGYMPTIRYHYKICNHTHHLGLRMVAAVRDTQNGRLKSRMPAIYVRLVPSYPHPEGKVHEVRISYEDGFNQVVYTREVRSYGGEVDVIYDVECV
ncbi:hypothetical protein BDN70DRAFT_946471 [Pholiota conissans]|uniref:Uncharacterized protein n=1 Tax=Pholiota conissans TaxID=109636 RepID=A0A9P6CSR5_9AGAR|nr:hypothetical protein BDN70DRAFT_946471 [Pholiota conissans]